jgi:hypothetical protein
MITLDDDRDAAALKTAQFFNAANLVRAQAEVAAA